MPWGAVQTHPTGLFISFFEFVAAFVVANIFFVTYYFQHAPLDLLFLIGFFDVI